MRAALVDFSAMNSEIGEELEQAYREVMHGGRFILGERVDEFERQFAAYCGARHCVGVGTGLDALTLSLIAGGIGGGDEVIVPSNTYVATWLAVSHAGATPVPVEPDIRTSNIDPERIEEAIGPRTKAIMPVDMYGQPVDADAIRDIAAEHGLKVILDAAQSHGAVYRGRRTGSYADVTCFSFYPTKNLGAAGDGGAVVTDDDALASELRKYRNYGTVTRYISEVSGFNSRLDELQAAFLSVKLRHLDRWNARRNSIASAYGSAFSSIGGGVEAPFTIEGVTPSWYLYVLRVRERERIRRELEERGVETNVHYPLPPHLQPAYSGMGYGRGSFPVAEELAGSVLSIPMHQYLTDEQVELIISAVEEACAGQTA